MPAEIRGVRTQAGSRSTLLQGSLVEAGALGCVSALVVVAVEPEPYRRFYTRHSHRVIVSY